MLAFGHRASVMGCECVGRVVFGIQYNWSSHTYWYKKIIMRCKTARYNIEIHVNSVIGNNIHCVSYLQSAVLT